MPEPKTKLPYDVPYRIYEMLKEDAEKEKIAATQLLIRLIEDNHKKESD